MPSEHGQSEVQHTGPRCYLLVMFSMGYGLGQALENWPGGAVSSGVGLVLALVALRSLWVHVRSRVAHA